MSGYFQSLQVSVLLFPLIGALVFVPLRFAHYRRYGELHEYRAFVSYLFTFAVMTAMLLTVLPLPSETQTICHWRDRVQNNQFVPLASILDIFAYKQSHFLTWSLRDLVANKALLQIVLNTILLAPAGFFFRALYELSFRTTVILAFLLSLTLELTQITGIWGLANCPYRIFDVDDLLTNTAGGALGWAAFGLFRWLPSPRASEDDLWYRKRKTKRARSQ